MRYVLLMAFVAFAEVFVVWKFISAIGVGTHAVWACLETLSTAVMGILGVFILMHETALWLYPPNQDYWDEEPPVVQVRHIGG